MRLYLMQHGEAKPKEEDPDRPLTARGREDVRRVARVVARAVSGVPVRHSGKTRARATADLVAGAARGDVVASDGLDPLDDPGDWLGRLAARTDDVVLVGHLPHLARLTSRLVTGDAARTVVRMQMGGMVCLERAEDGTWAVCWMVVPALIAE